MSTTDITTYRSMEYTQGTPQMGWCPAGNHAAYKYEVDRFAINAGGQIKEWRIMACSCGHVAVWPVVG
jgi:hypothetical protein